MNEGPFHSQSSIIKIKNLQRANNSVDSSALPGNLRLRPV
jgi:hypothetical protein